MIFKDIIDSWTNPLILKIKVSPNSKKNELFSVMDNWVFKVRLKAIPEKWKANKELIDFLSNELGVNKNQIKILSWLSDKNKIVKVDF